jgi:hypothetical protein
VLSVLGLEVVRDNNNRTLCCTMKKKITELAKKFGITNDKHKFVPIPPQG